MPRAPLKIPPHNPPLHLPHNLPPEPHPSRPPQNPASGSSSPTPPPPSTLPSASVPVRPLPAVAPLRKLPPTSSLLSPSALMASRNGNTPPSRVHPMTPIRPSPTAEQSLPPYQPPPSPPPHMPHGALKRDANLANPSKSRFSAPKASQAPHLKAKQPSVAASNRPRASNVTPKPDAFAKNTPPKPPPPRKKSRAHAKPLPGNNPRPTPPNCKPPSALAPPFSAHSSEKKHSPPPTSPAQEPPRAVPPAP